jgi:hypothetical protein
MEFLDKDDKCPEVKVLLNKGCPEVSEAVMMKLNEYKELSCLILENLFQKNKLTQL